MKTEAVYMQQLLEHPGWKLLVLRLEKIKAGLEDQILDGTCEKGLEEDLLRVKRLDIKMLVEMPSRLAEMYANGSEEMDIDSYITPEELELERRAKQSH